MAHSLLVVIYTMLKQGKSYLELGVDYFEKLHADDFKTVLGAQTGGPRVQGHLGNRSMSGEIFEGVSTLHAGVRTPREVA